MSTLIAADSEIPDAPLYVIATDTFMSGWGQAQGKDNIIILPCEDEEEAERVAQYAESRPEQKDVEIITGKPLIHDAALYSLLTRGNAARWYRGL